MERAAERIAASPLPRLMLVTDRGATAGRDLVDVVAAAVEGGVGLVQVRERDLPVAELAALLRRVVERLRGSPARVLVNGHPALARALEVGLHLPASAPPPGGPRPGLYGRAAHDEAEVRRARVEGVDYLVIGPVFPTASHPGEPGTGPARLAALVRAASPVPVFAIGGLTPARAAAVRAAGVHGVAVRSAILGADDPRAAARRLLQALAGRPA
jgi:thiamine-phosphate diphosphorylase